MTNYDDCGFDTRLRRLEKQHRKLMRGSVTTMRPDGLLVLQPRRFAVWRFFTPVLFVVCMGLMIKAVTYAAIGEIAYQERVEKLQSGTSVERYAAVFAGMDLVSLWGADQILKYTPKAYNGFIALFD